MTLKQLTILATPDVDPTSVASFVWRNGDDPTILDEVIVILQRYREAYPDKLRAALASQPPIDPV